jgi:hypothetical protein
MTTVTKGSALDRSTFDVSAVRAVSIDDDNLPRLAFQPGVLPRDLLVIQNNRIQAGRAADRYWQGINVFVPFAGNHIIPNQA